MSRNGPDSVRIILARLDGVARNAAVNGNPDYTYIRSIAAKRLELLSDVSGRLQAIYDQTGDSSGWMCRTAATILRDAAGADYDHQVAQTAYIAQAATLTAPVRSGIGNP